MKRKFEENENKINIFEDLYTLSQKPISLDIYGVKRWFNNDETVNETIINQNIYEKRYNPTLCETVIDPIIYQERYTPSHRPFKTFQWRGNDTIGREVMNLLIKTKKINISSKKWFIKPQIPTDYLKNYFQSTQVLGGSGLTESQTSFFASPEVFHDILSSEQLQLSGTLLSAWNALQLPMKLPINETDDKTVITGRCSKPFSVNMGGGRHHASYTSPGFWCLFDDVGFTCHEILKIFPEKRILVIDGDIHRGNGYSRSKMEKYGLKNMSILDIFNPDEYPYKHDLFSLEAVNFIGRVSASTRDGEYLQIWNNLINEAFCTSFDLILYINGVDPVHFFTYGERNFNLTQKTLILRDEILFKKAHLTPLAMCLAGGYPSAAAAKTIYLSLSNLKDKFDIF
eukprot:GHVL01032131.1.p1 GENE.GHVL01032131.1~~GHVL01032131.1.p1  ORF type:complete len:399 (-),score=85.60 GHVL01032131.1:24-1220(-)